MTYATIASFDGHNIPITVYRPDGAGPDSRVPVVLHSHGWGGARETRLEAFRAFTDEDLAVVSIDMRGHGEARANSQSHVASPAYEVRDVMAVITHLATLDWVAMESRDDPVVGAMGESYGGAYGLLTAAFDSRLDAVVAENTWNDLATAMAPNGVPKTAWFASLWLSAAIQGRIHPEVRTGFESAIQTGAIPDGSGSRPSLLQAFRASSPANYTGRIQVPTLLMQGDNDTLFDLGQAFANHALVDDAGAEVALVTHLGGHVITGSTRPSAQSGSAQATPSATSPAPRSTWRHPCGEPEALALSWFKAHLASEAAALPAACVALDDGSTLTGGQFPLPGTRSLPFAAADLEVQVGNVTSRSRTDLFVADREMAIVGTPELAGRIASGPTNGTVYWSLEAVAQDGRVRMVNGQVAPMRLGSQAAEFRVPLAAVALHLQEGETLRLAVSAHEPIFSSPPARQGQATRFTQLELHLPVVESAYST